MKITAIEGFALSSPYGHGRSLGQPLGIKSVGFVEVRTDSGLVGIGETYAGVYIPELVGPITEFIGARLIGLDPRHPREIAKAARIPFVTRNGVFCSVYSAIDIALWDIAGQAAGQPVWALLGSVERQPLRSYLSGGSAAFDPADVVADALRAKSSSCTAFKMRVGYQSWERDLERVAAARHSLGPDTGLMVDAIMGTLNPAWSPEIARNRIADLAAFDPIWIEEPLHPDDVEGLAKVRKSSVVPIAAGEALTGALDYSSYLALGAVDVLQIDVTHCGGITVGHDIAENARAVGIPVAMHVWGSAVAHAANAHLAHSHASVDWLEVPMIDFEVSRQMVPAWDPDSSSSQRSTTPGIGVEMPEHVKSQYRLVPGSGYRL